MRIKPTLLNFLHSVAQQSLLVPGYSLIPISRTKGATFPTGFRSTRLYSSLNNHSPRGSMHTIVFDLDGTLVDSSGGLQDAVNTFLKAEGYRGSPLSKKEVEPMMGDGIHTVANRALKYVGLPEKSDPLSDGKSLGLIYNQNPSGKTVVYEGVYDTLAILKDHRFPMVVCTNKAQAPALQILQQLDLLHFFDGQCVGGDVLSVRKPHADHLLHAVGLVGGNPNKVVMIGDGHNDVLVAKNANVPCIALSWGYSRIPLSELEPEMIIDDFREIPTAINNILSLDL
mmetsp:Transcript_2334/g.4156  ORF Transcript_2334/g.4156 Transcript_2334/m.4156 type:complete len:284 (+) Transcript_2334:94-945(+)